MHTKNSKQVQETAASQRLYENSMRTKGQSSSTYENLVHTKFSGFTVTSSKGLQLTSNFQEKFPEAWAFS